MHGFSRVGFRSRPPSGSQSAPAACVEVDLDFRGTLAVDREAPVGFSAIRLSIEVEADATEDQLATLRELTERYCVSYQTLAGAPAVSTTLRTA